MTIHSISPGFIVVFYTSNGHNHKHIIPISAPVDTGGSVYTIATKSAGAVAVTAAMATWVAAVKVLFPASTTFLYWELWTKPTPESDPIFRQTGDLSVVGTNGGAVVPYSQIVYSYRTSLGGVGKMQFQEISLAANQVFKPTYASPHNGVVSYLTGSQSIYAGRDEGFPVSVPRALTKTNDQTRKKFLLDVS